MWQFFQKEIGKLSNRQNILTEKKINRQNKQKDKHDVARQRIWFFESSFHAGTTRFFFGQKKRKLHKKGKLGNKTRKWKPNAEEEPCNFNQSEPLMLIV